MRNAKRISAQLRHKELEHAAFGVVHGILLRSLHGTLVPTVDELATLLAISNCSAASVHTKIFTRNVWEWLVHPDGQQPASGKLSITLRVRDALRRLPQSAATVFSSELQDP